MDYSISSQSTAERTPLITTVKTYIWDGEKWTATVITSFDEAYVNIDGDTMTGNLTVPSLNGGPLAGLRNQIINGSFAIAQRSVNETPSGPNRVGYLTADRWAHSGSGDNVGRIVRDRASCKYWGSSWI